MAELTVATPIDAYHDKSVMWARARAMCGGESLVKDHDVIVHARHNFLIPFSPSMDQEQYDFLKSEAELPGICAQFSRMLVGALLRKKPEVSIPDNAPAGALDWILNEFGADDSPLSSFLDVMLWEEVVTSRSWVFVDYPELEKDENGEPVEIEGEDNRVPYPVLYPAEAVINWKRGKGANGKEQLTRVIISVAEEVEGKSEFHSEVREKICVHELVGGVYRVRMFLYNDKEKDWFETPDSPVTPLKRGQPLDYIPGWPGNGSYEPIDPLLTTIIDKEAALYNKLTRRNHLLYGASTYTPYITGDLDDVVFNKIVRSGLGSWLNLPADTTLQVLNTPTEALADYDRSIAAGIEEMAKLGIRMLSPETDQSGIALQLRNASQSAQLGTLNAKISAIMAQVIATMLNWRYGTDYRSEDITFTLSDDFNPMPLGESWLRLATEWYENGHIPKSVWVMLLKQNDILPSEYSEKRLEQELANDETFTPPVKEDAKSFIDKVK